MPLQATRAVGYTFYMKLIDSASRPGYKASPTLAAGDFKISKDGGAEVNLATLPVVSPAGSTSVKVVLSAIEATAGQIVITAIDAAGAEWDDNAEYIDTVPAPANLKQIEEAATSGNNAVLKLNRLEIITAGSDPAVQMYGGSGKGLRVIGGASDAAVSFESDTNGTGLEIIGYGIGVDITGPTGMKIVSASGVGLDIQGSTQGIKVAASPGIGIDVQGFNHAIYANSTTAQGLYVRSAAGTAGVFQGTNTGDGLTCNGGITGDGASFIGGSTSGHAMVLATTDGDGLRILANGASKAGILINAPDAGSKGMDITGGNGSNSAGIEVSAVYGDAVRFYAGTSGVGLHVKSGATSGDAVFFEVPSGSAGNGLHIIAQGAGHGIFTRAQGDGNGIYANGATNGSGIYASGGNNGPGLRLLGFAAQPGLLSTGGTTSGDGILGVGGAPDGTGIHGYGTGAGAGVYAQGGGSNSYGFLAAGVGSGAGARLVGGNTAGNGLQVVAGTNGNGFAIVGNGSGNGIQIDAGATGTGLNILATSGPAISAVTDAGVGLYISSGTTHAVQFQASEAGTGLRVEGGEFGIGFLAQGDTAAVLGGGAAGLNISGDDGVLIDGVAGAGILVTATAEALKLTGSPGLAVTGNAGQPAVLITAGSGSNGINIAASDGVGINISVQGIGNQAVYMESAAGHGFEIQAGGSGSGMKISGGANGEGLSVFAFALNPGVHIESQAGTGLLTKSSSGGHGIEAIGDGLGYGIKATGGNSNGHGIAAYGNGQFGIGIKAESAGEGAGIDAYAGDGPGIKATGTGSGSGIIATGGTSGHGIRATVLGTGNGLSIYSATTDAIHAESAAVGSGMRLLGVQGILAEGTTAGGKFLGSATHSVGLASIGTGLQPGMYAKGGDSAGPGFYIDSGIGGSGLKVAGAILGVTIESAVGAGFKSVSFNGNGVETTGGTGGHGFIATGDTTGSGIKGVGDKDLDAKEILEIQNAVNNLSVAGAAINQPAASYTLTIGSVVSGTIANTETLDGVYLQLADAAGTLDARIEFLLTGADVPVSVTWNGKLNGNNDSLIVEAYDWIGAAWQQIGSIDGQVGATDISEEWILYTKHVGTGVDLGKVIIRFQDTSLTSSNFYIDRIFISYSVVAAPEGYANGAVWYNSNASNTGTVKNVDGVVTNPVSTWSAVLTLLAATGLSRVQILNGSTTQLSANSDNLTLLGSNWTLDLNGQSIAGMYVQGAKVSGACSGSEYTFQKCIIAKGTPISFNAGTLSNCALAGDMVLTEAGTYYWDGCYSGAAGAGATPSVDYSAAVGNTNLNMRHYSGGIELLNMNVTGSDRLSLEGHGQVIADASCIGGDAAVRGHFPRTDNSTGAGITWSDLARYDGQQVRDAAKLAPTAGTFAAESLDSNLKQVQEIAASAGNTGRRLFPLGGNYYELVPYSQAGGIYTHRRRKVRTGDTVPGAAITSLPSDSIQHFQDWEDCKSDGTT